MAQQITRLLPDRSINEKDVINLYSLDTASGEAGSFVKVAAGNLTEDPVKYVARNGANGGFANSLGNGRSRYPEVPYKVTLCGGTGDAGRCIGMLLRDVRETDENGEKLLFYPEKKAELQCVVSGEAVPIATRGVVEVNSRAFTNGVKPNVGDVAVLAANGTVTGVAFSALSAEQKDAVVGKFIATGNRESQQTPDAFAGAYAKLLFSL